VALPFAAVWIAGWMIVDNAGPNARAALVLGQT